MFNKSSSLPPLSLILSDIVIIIANTEDLYYQYGFTILLFGVASLNDYIRDANIFNLGTLCP